jgi:hypothetical protein
MANEQIEMVGHGSYIMRQKGALVSRSQRQDFGIGSTFWDNAVRGLDVNPGPPQRDAGYNCTLEIGVSLEPQPSSRFPCHSLFSAPKSLDQLRGHRMLLAHFFPKPVLVAQVRFDCLRMIQDKRDRSINPGKAANQRKILEYGFRRFALPK